MNPAADQDLLLYSALPNDPDCKNEYLLPQSIQEERGFFQDPSLSYYFPSTSQPGILQGSWHPTSAQADHALDGWFDRDWVLFPDTPDPVEQPDDIMEISVVLSSYGSLEEAQFRVDRHVQRALQQRHLEAQSGKNKCPANAFILYRIGFQCVAEEFYSTKCQQLVSRICGKSWQLESDDVKAWFQQQATIQKANYTQAFEHA